MILRRYGCDAFLHNGFVVQRRWTKEIGHGESKAKHGERASIELERASDLQTSWSVGVTMINSLNLVPLSYAHEFVSSVLVSSSTEQVETGWQQAWTFDWPRR
jgi:hypothetical protein